MTKKQPDLPLLGFLDEPFAPRAPEPVPAPIHPKPQEPSVPVPTRARRPSVPEPRLLPWERILVRTGFNDCRTEDGAFDLSGEESYNREFFSRLLERVDIADQFDGIVFRPVEDFFDEDLWLAAHTQCHGRVEGPPPDETGFHRMRLDLLDTFLSGFLRWLNYTGILTVNSCDGHGERWPYIRPQDRLGDKELLGYIVTIISQGNLLYRHNSRYELQTRPTRRRTSHRERAIQRSIPSGLRFDFLDYAETLHRNGEALRVAVDKLKHVQAEVTS